MSASRRSLLLPLTLVLAGCGRYGEFTLPPLPGPAPTPLAITLQPDPVFLPATTGWDSAEVLNPSVLLHDRQYWNFYSGYDGKIWHTGVATSPDGAAWTRRARILSPDPATWEQDYIAANGATLFRGNEFLTWYEGGGHETEKRIGLARSTDGTHFRKEPKPVLDVGPYQSWDERAVADPYVFETNGWLYMYYLGQDRARRQRIGVARSQDGLTWEKLRANPVIELDEGNLGEPAIFIWKGRYRMLLTATGPDQHRRLVAYWSNDGIRWTREPGEISGTQSWDAIAVCDPTVVVEENRVRLWFGGGDSTRPDEGLHGRIGTGTIE